MKVLVAANMYPSRSRPADGIFISREVDSLRKHVPEVEVEVVHVDTVGSRARYVTEQGAVGRAVKRFKPDLLHVHFGLTQLLCTGWTGPRVLTVHGSDLEVRWKRAVTTSMLRLRRASVVSVSPTLLSHLGEADRRLARVIPCGVDPAVFSPGDSHAARRSLGWDVGRREFLIGFPSSPSRPEKDYGLFQQVIDECRQQGRAVRGVALSGIAPERMVHALRAIDALVVTSRHEGSPVVTKEALCCGTRVVSVGVGDVAAQIAGLSGCVVSATREAGDIADALVRALEANGPDAGIAAARFDVSTQAFSIREVYQETLEAW